MTAPEPKWHPHKPGHPRRREVSEQKTVDCGLFWCQAVGVYHSGGGGKREVRATANLTADASEGQPFHAFSHSLEIKAPSVSPDMIGKRFRVLLVEESK